jgi:hypothetical protein
VLESYASILANEYEKYACSLKPNTARQAEEDQISRNGLRAGAEAEQCLQVSPRHVEPKDSPNFGNRLLGSIVSMRKPGRMKCTT